jgi:carotenoid cleavage dioxygenase
MPIHLEGNNAPVSDEVDVDAAAVRVVGALPEDLRGTFYRNGPNPRSGWSPHLFAGDGMVHAVTVGDAGIGYRNRYVRTPLWADPSTPRTHPRVTTANTHVVEHAGRLLALEEGGWPYELDGALDTIGPFRFDGRLRGAMTAHPKRCPRTGELLFFGYALRPPFLTYHRATADGALAGSVDIDLPRSSMLHDFAITETRAVFLASCFTFDLASLAETGSPWRWDPSVPARVGVIERDAASDTTRWFDIEPCHLSHAANAHDDGDAVVLTGTRVVGVDGDQALPRMHEWRIDLSAGAVKETALDDLVTEYPRVADGVVGRPHRFTYLAGFFYEAEPDHGEISKYDGAVRTTRRLPSGQTCGEPVFVARAGGTAEDDGYLLTFVHDRATTTSHLLVLDARDLSTRAELHLPVRVPGGFHGTWVPAV